MSFKVEFFEDRSVEDAALKMLEPVEPGIGARSSSIAAFKVLVE